MSLETRKQLLEKQIMEDILSDFVEVDVEELEGHGFMGLIACCNTIPGKGY